MIYASPAYKARRGVLILFFFFPCAGAGENGFWRISNFHASIYDFAAQAVSYVPAFVMSFLFWYASRFGAVTGAIYLLITFFFANMYVYTCTRLQGQILGKFFEKKLLHSHRTLSYQTISSVILLSNYKSSASSEIFTPRKKLTFIKIFTFSFKVKS